MEPKDQPLPPEPEKKPDPPPKATQKPAEKPKKEAGVSFLSKLKGGFDKSQQKQIRKIARDEAEKVMDENMRVFRAMMRTAQTPDTEIATKEFRGTNPSEMSREIKTWLKKIEAIKISHTNETKDPMSNFGIIKTVYAVVPKKETPETPDDEDE